MISQDFYHRFSEQLLYEAINDTPVVLIHGSRQCGKTTLALEIGRKLGYSYISFDDDTARQAAQIDPIGFIQNLPEYCILDEIQRIPELFTAIKLSVDTNRKPGRFILTGSANVLLLPKLADSLAGRIEIIRLRPLAQVEIANKPSSFLRQLFTADFTVKNKAKNYPQLGEKLAAIISAGGYPAAIARNSEKRRLTWYRDYVTSLIQRDIKDLSKIRQLDAIPKLLALAAGQTGRLFNANDLASPFSLSRTTIREYLTLLEQIFLIEHLPPWHSNRLSRLIKTPKLHLTDTGLASALLGMSSTALWNDRSLLGQLLETFIYQELRKLADWHDQHVTFYHFRNKDQIEVDIIIEQGKKIAGIEIKAAATVHTKDFKGLNKLQEVCGKDFACGVIFYDGQYILPFGERLFAVPISILIPK